MNEGDGAGRCTCPTTPPLIKAQTKLTALFVLMALSGGILAQISYEQFLPEKTCNDPTTTMERIEFHCRSSRPSSLASTSSSSCFGFCSTGNIISVFLAC